MRTRAGSGAIERYGSWSTGVTVIGNLLVTRGRPPGGTGCIRRHDGRPAGGPGMGETQGRLSAATTSNRTGAGASPVDRIASPIARYSQQREGRRRERPAPQAGGPPPPPPGHQGRGTPPPPGGRGGGGGAGRGPAPPVDPGPPLEQLLVDQEPAQRRDVVVVPPEH